MYCIEKKKKKKKKKKKNPIPKTQQSIFIILIQINKCFRFIIFIIFMGNNLGVMYQDVQMCRKKQEEDIVLKKFEQLCQIGKGQEIYGNFESVFIQFTIANLVCIVLKKKKNTEREYITQTRYNTYFIFIFFQFFLSHLFFAVV
eukprot:TRINITY_DN25575_c0_g1_i10.p2 TRINITY_DN25575_c0_g1~~TRINITY_DN25575_c0_g1_i10.p2  ORF type:complete len:144 (-),score=11.51 TRINITY_DN25575_c0_g1_i10:45-476(-)